jgi:hypothetical protein
MVARHRPKPASGGNRQMDPPPPTTRKVERNGTVYEQLAGGRDEQVQQVCAAATETYFARSRAEGEAQRPQKPYTAETADVPGAQPAPPAAVEAAPAEAPPASEPPKEPERPAATAPAPASEPNAEAAAVADPYDALRDMQSERGQRWHRALEALRAINEQAPVAAMFDDRYRAIDHAIGPEIAREVGVAESTVRNVASAQERKPAVSAHPGAARPPLAAGGVVFAPRFPDPLPGMPPPAVGVDPETVRNVEKRNTAESRQPPGRPPGGRGPAPPCGRRGRGRDGHAPSAIRRGRRLHRRRSGRHRGRADSGCSPAPRGRVRSVRARPAAPPR